MILLGSRTRPRSATGSARRARAASSLGSRSRWRGGSGTASYVVKSGGELHPGTAATWMHPAGPDGGSDAPGISNVDLCDDDGGGGDGDGPGDDGPGDDVPGDGPIG